MALTINELEGQGVLEVTYSPEDVTREDLAYQRRQVADAISRSSLKRVLIDAAEIKQFPSAAMIVDHNSAISSNSTLMQVKFAVVCNSLGEDEKFLETTGFNRGLQIKCFTSKESAMNWLSDS